MKALTTCYAFANLGTDFRFVTRLVATGPIAGGVLNGDLDRFLQAALAQRIQGHGDQQAG